MKIVRLPSLPRFRGWLIAGLLGWASSGITGTVTFSVSPSSISNTYSGKITLQINGLTNGESVVVDRYLDANTNGVIDAGDWLVQSFRLTDGKACVIGGVTNGNIAGDSNPTNGAITARFRFQADGIAQKFTGTHLWRLSSPTGRFPSLTNTWTITDTPYAQAASGTVQNGGTNVPYAGILVFPPPSGNGGSSPIAGTVADASGAYSINLPPGDYQLWALKSNAVCDMDAAPVVTLNPGIPVITNLILIPATCSISGRFIDATRTNIGLLGLLVVAQSTNNLIAFGFTDTNGNYAVNVTPGGWQISADGEELPSYGYLNLRDEYRPSVDATASSVSNVIVGLPPATALIYGTATDNLGNPLAGLSLYAENTNRLYEVDLVTDGNGKYVMGVLAGEWYVGHSHDSPDYASYVFSEVDTNIVDGQAALVDFMGSAGTTISGCVQGEGNPLSGVNVQVGTITTNGTGGWHWNQTYQSDGTDSHGNYSVIVPPGTNYYASVNLPQGSPWVGQMYSNATDAASATVIAALTNAPVTGIDFALTLGMNISGWIMDASNNPVRTSVEIGQWDGTNWISVWWTGSFDDGHFSVALPAGSNYLVHINDPNYHEVYFHNKLSAGSADAIVAPPGTVVSNVNFTLYDPSRDSDGDGLPDYIEGYVTGTDPFDCRDCLRCIGLHPSGGRATLSWSAVSGRVYSVERTVDLCSAAWTNLPPLSIIAVGTNATLLDSNAPPRGNYRVRVAY